MDTYAAINNSAIRLDSSSGGVFSLLAEKQEIVFGVVLSEDCYSAEFRRFEGDYSLARGSKYLQANVGDTYLQVKSDLDSGKKVLFSGTGCQVNGLKLFLGKDYENLLCVDVVCHGVPSPKLWREYIAYQEKKYGKIVSVNFRAKDNGWQNFGIKENSHFTAMYKDPYMIMFLRDCCLRPSCYNCPAKANKMSDITLADFWGIDSIAPEMNDDLGTSLVIVRTDKGRVMFEAIKDHLKIKKVSYEEAIRSNPAEYCSASMPESRKTFFRDLSAKSFEEIIRLYAIPFPEQSFFSRSVRKGKRMLRKLIGK